jgi:hypothetical protein
MENTTELIKPEPVGLVNYDHMIDAIAKCYRVDEVKDVRDKLAACEYYSRIAGNREAEAQAAKVRLRAERRAGELLKEMAKSGERKGWGGDRRSKSGAPTLKTLTDIGISRDQSSQWQQLADVPEEDFEKEMQSPDVPSTEGVIAEHRLKKNPLPQVDPNATWLWDRLRDFERWGFPRRSANDLVSHMPAPLKEDVLRLAPQIVAWLQAIER